LTRPNRNLPGPGPGYGTLNAGTLGLLTFIITPLVVLVIIVPLLLLGMISESFNPIIVLAKILDLQDLGGFFAAQFVLMGLLALSGDFVAALLSWRVSHSSASATITFFSALTFQCVGLGIILPLTVKQSQRTMEDSLARELAYAQHATIGEASYETKGKYSDDEITNLYPEYGPLYRKLVITVPISVSQAGPYRVAVEYGFTSNGLSRSTPQKQVTRNLDAEEHTVRFEFLASESRGSYGYWSPGSVGGKIWVQLDYFAPKTGILNDGHTVAKFVGRKETQF